MDKNALLIEINRILGRTSIAESLEAKTPTPASASRKFNIPGTSVVDSAVIESIATLEWEDVLQFASLSMIPEDELILLTRALGESTAAYREAWNSLSERFEMPAGIPRGALVTAMQISPDEAVVRKVVEWSSRMIHETDSTVREKLAKKMPVLTKTVFPAGDAAKANKEKSDTERYMEPHEHSTDKPDEKKQVMTTRMFQDPEARVKEHEKSLKDVEKQLKQLTDLAAKSGKKPEEMFPNLHRDLMRERVRFS